MLQRCKLILGLLVISTAWAQSSLVNGAMEGAVTDPSGARIPGASVTRTSSHAETVLADIGARRIQFALDFEF